tara:strand:- start:425 stop:787 length:363 start_codon:yes stop_codon:yes gene_type:complete
MKKKKKKKLPKAKMNQRVPLDYTVDYYSILRKGVVMDTDERGVVVMGTKPEKSKPECIDYHSVEYLKFYHAIERFAHLPPEEGEYLLKKLKFFRTLLDSCGNWEEFSRRLEVPTCEEIYF